MWTPTLTQHNAFSLKPYNTVSTGFQFIPPPLTVPEIQERTYLIEKNHMLINDIYQVESQKHYYRNKLQTELRNHQEELQEAFKTISQKTNMIITLEQQLQRERKQIRLLSDDYVTLKNQSVNDKRMFEREVQILKQKNIENLKQLEHKLNNQHEIKLNNKVKELTQNYQSIIALKNREIEDLINANQNIIAQLKRVQEEHRQLLMKIDGMIQDQLQKELRRRDREQRERYNQDLAYRESLKRQNGELKQKLIERQNQNTRLNEEIKKLKAQNDLLRGKLEQLQMSLKKFNKNDSPKKEEQEQDIQKIGGDVQTNTPNQYFPLPIPTNDLNMVCLIQSLKQFIGQSLVEIFSEIFIKSGSQGGKAKSNSLNTFTININSAKQSRREISLLIYTYTKLHEILKVYYPPALIKEVNYMTLKQGFVRNFLQDAQSISKKPIQYLYRLLQLVTRINTPINHTKTKQNLSESALKTVQRKVIEASQRIFY